MKLDHSQQYKKGNNKNCFYTGFFSQKPTVAGTPQNSIHKNTLTEKNDAVFLVFLFGFKQTGRMLRPVSESGKIVVDGDIELIFSREKHPHSIGPISLDHLELP